jgi:hypothetical protein
MMYVKNSKCLKVCPKCFEQITESSEWLPHLKSCGASAGIDADYAKVEDVIAPKASSTNMLRPSDPNDGFATYDASVSHKVDDTAAPNVPEVVKLSLLDSIKENASNAEAPRKPGRPKKQGA